MIRYYILGVVVTLIVACEKKEPLEPLETSRYSHNHPKPSNPGLAPIEKPNIEEEYYDAPQIQ